LFVPSPRIESLFPRNPKLMLEFSDQFFSLSHKRGRSRVRYLRSLWVGLLFLSHRITYLELCMISIKACT